ncbi:MAG: hypothetical protein ACLR1M_10780 [Oscillospiraceae bacterium]
MNWGLNLILTTVLPADGALRENIVDLTCFSINGRNIRASAYGTGFIQKKVAGKKRRVNNGTAEQRRLLHDVRELEDTLEPLQAEEELDAALDAKMAPIGGNARKRETQAQEPCQTRDIRCRENGCYRWRNNERTGAWVSWVGFSIIG